MIQFKDDVSAEDFQKITDAAYSLQAIPGVEALNFGQNVSPEGLTQGYEHSLTMKFFNATDQLQFLHTSHLMCFLNSSHPLFYLNHHVQELG